MTLEKWQIDTARSTVGFTVRHMVVTKVHGRFTRWQGDLELDLDDVAASSVRASIEVASIETRDAERDAYLRSTEFLDPQRHPTLEFRSTRIEATDAKTYRVRGDLTIRGVTREVVLDATLAGRRDEPLGGRIRFQATTKIDRKTFGLEWGAALEAGGFLVGDKIDIVLEIEAMRAPLGT